MSQYREHYNEILWWDFTTATSLVTTYYGTKTLIVSPSHLATHRMAGKLQILEIDHKSEKWLPIVPYFGVFGDFYCHFTEKKMSIFWFHEFHFLCLNRCVVNCGVLESEQVYIGNLPIYAFLILTNGHPSLHPSGDCFSAKSEESVECY